MDNFRDVLKIDGVRAKGFGIIPKMVMLDRKLTIEAKAIYSYFCSYAGAGTTAFPSVEKIIGDLDISKKRYYNHFKLLKDLGYIEVEQIKSENNKFSHNIYTLVEKPIEKPCSQNDTTEEKEEKPCSRFAYTQIGTTQNDTTKNNISFSKNNNLLYNQSVSHKKEKQPTRITTDGQTEFQNINNYFKDKLSYKDLKITYSSDDKLIDEIEINILEMFFNKYTIINGQKQSQNIVRNALLKLTYWHIDSLIFKYKEISSITKIKSPKQYIQTMIYNLAFENDLALKNELINVGAI